MIQINIEGDPFELFNKKIDKSEELTRQLSETWKRFVDDKFQAQGIPRWIPLAPSTLKSRNKKGYSLNGSPKILQRTRNLWSSVQPFFNKEEAGTGTNLFYAGIHEFGGTIHISGRTRTLFHRTDAKGNLLRRSKGNLLVFAKASHKRKSAYTFGQKSYNIIVPARPFIKLTQEDKEILGEQITKFLLS